MVREGYAVAIDGSPIYYRVLGREDGPTLALCDGIGCDGYVWKYLVPELASEYRMVHWHYRGHGRTPTPRAALMGHSMGVQVCLEGYRRHRERVNGLVLMCGSYGHPLRTFKGRKTMEGLLPWVSFSVGLAPKLTSALLRYTVPTKLAYAVAARMEINGELVRLEDFMPYLEHIGNLDPTLFLGMLAQAGRHSAREILPTVDVPALIVAGTRDGFTPARLSEEMHDLMRGSELLMIGEGSHTAPIERPDLVCRTVHRFLDERVAGLAHERAPVTPTRAAR